MQRVNLGKPYEEFIQQLVSSGYYASASEVLRDALRSKMEENEKWKSFKLKQLVQAGLDDVAAGRVVPFDEKLMNKAFENAIQNSKNAKIIPDHLKP
ncbi:type II toxin-antitoxin system ParD family antitoxin [Lacihabitans sp. LS3-19]|uniref:type II toxin-antitoxin system ParD family antitoxin n=1 Tax=Lacihabitans sp. LS3-19 TaxID=2487335 RepID=UPI0020CE8C4C|nr:type II toxin-antitoxin system ParD family antitoxin [Lacihabitans sp. LS3-19]MCP9767168.1 type II toxin-antitoxin system ParD family antitoxin [Lacihabitans sp. LS3-19]